MPVHWMYSLSQLKRDYGVITEYRAPLQRFEGSIMSLSNTGGGGRGSDSGEIVGSVILHGKKKYWVRQGNFHYHCELHAGENTLEAQLARLLMRATSSAASADATAASVPSLFLRDYVTFMTTPGSHNDTYASTCHRMFFANFVRRVPPEQCADNDGHNTDAIDALTLVIPIVVRYTTTATATVPAATTEEGQGQGQGGMAVEDICALANAVIALTRKSTKIKVYANAYVRLLHAVLRGADLRAAVEATGKELYGEAYSVARRSQESAGDPMVACYIESSFPALLHFAYKYADNVGAAVLANANAGGENVARGSLLGALLGAAHGLPGFPAWSLELYHKAEILSEIDTFLRETRATDEL